MNKCIPDIDILQSNINPCICSINSPYGIYLSHTKEEFDDVEVYKNFLNCAKSQFRKSRTYKTIKATLIERGLDKSQINGNLNNDMCTIEMHHCILTLFDVELLITEHTINTIGYINTFYLVRKLKEEHRDCNIPLVMLDKTTHQLADNTDELYIPPNMIFGNWWNLLQKYPYGITLEIAYKIVNYLNKALQEEDVEKNNILQLRDYVMSWANFNS